MMTEQQGIRKAAVFLNGLDKETAGMLLQRLPAEESRAIRREMVVIEGISPSEINKTVRQFLKETKFGTSMAWKTNATASVECRHQTVISDDGMDTFEWSGQANHAETPCRATREPIDIERDVPAATIEQETATPIAEPTIAETLAQPRRFDYLERRSALETAGFLAEEGEQLIAVVLSQMTPRYSGDVLACFEQSLKRDIIRRLARLDATDETILDEIDAVLKDRLKHEVEDRPKTKPGLALLEQILQVVESELSNEIISGLNEIDLEEQQAAYCEPCVEYDQYGETWNDESMAYEDLGMLDDHELGDLFRSMDRDNVVQTLMSGDVYFVERVLGLFPVYEQVNLRETLRR